MTLRTRLRARPAACPPEQTPGEGGGGGDGGCLAGRGRLGRLAGDGACCVRRSQHGRARGRGCLYLCARGNFAGPPARRCFGWAGGSRAGQEHSRTGKRAPLQGADINARRNAKHDKLRFEHRKQRDEEQVSQSAGRSPRSDRGHSPNHSRDEQLLPARRNTMLRHETERVRAGAAIVAKLRAAAQPEWCPWSLASPSAAAGG